MEDSWSCIKDLRSSVEDLQIKTEKTKENIEKINLILEKVRLKHLKFSKIKSNCFQWKQKPIFERRDEKKDSFFHFEDREMKMKKIFTCIQEDSEIIKELIQVRSHKTRKKFSKIKTSNFYFKKFPF